MLRCTSPPCSLQSLSRDLLDKMATSLAQNKTMTKLELTEYDWFQMDKSTLSAKENVKLFTHHLLLGLSNNTTLTDLSLGLPPQCWDWPCDGELNDSV